MTLDDLDTWWSNHSQFVGAGSKYDISIALNNDPKAQDSYKTLTMTAKMSHGNGRPWTRDFA